MTIPPPYEKEKERLEAVHKMGIMNTTPDPRYDALTKEACRILKVPISTISILDEKKEFYKSCQGLDTNEGPREVAFCSWALLADNVFVVEDTLLDQRFKDNPYVTGKPFIRFYAGISIRDAKTGLPVGVFCVKDTKPRKLNIEETSALFELAGRAEVLINS